MSYCSHPPALSTFSSSSNSSLLPLPITRSIKCRNQSTSYKSKRIVSCLLEKTDVRSIANPQSFLPLGALLTAMVDQPAFAVTGSNNYEVDLNSLLIQSGIAAVWYFLVMPPIIMNWLRLRWYKRKFFEMYLQFMCVFLFFPGIILWAPFLNFRRMPRDPSMKYPWSTPQDPSINNSR